MPRSFNASTASAPSSWPASKRTSPVERSTTSARKQAFSTAASSTDLSIERSVDDAAVEKACFLADVVDLSTGEVLFEAGQELGADAVEALKERGIKEVELFFPDWDLSGDVLVNTIRKDTHKTKNEAILEIYR